MRVLNGIAGLWVVGLLFAGSAWAEVGQRGSLLHIRTGMLGGSVKSTTFGSSVSVPTALDVEFEFLLGHGRSTFMRTVLGYELSSSRLPYAGLLTGLRFDMIGSAARQDYAAGGDFVEKSPRFRLYVGGDLGVSQMTVQTVGPVLSVNTALIEFGGSVGAVWAVGQKLGIELHGAYGMGMGFANISASASIYRLFLGVTLPL